MEYRNKNKKFYENLTRINTILLSILLVVIGLDFLKEILNDDSDLLYPLFYAILGFALITYFQHMFFTYFDNHISPLLRNLLVELKQSNQKNITDVIPSGDTEQQIEDSI